MESNAGLVPVAVAAKRLGVSEQLVGYWIRAGKVPGAKRVTIEFKPGHTREQWHVPADISYPADLRKGRKPKHVPADISYPADLRKGRKPKHVQTARADGKREAGQKDAVQRVWEASGTKSVRQLAEELGVTPRQVHALFDEGVRRYA